MIRIAGAAALDPRGLVSSTGVVAAIDPYAKMSWKPTFESPFKTFRRLDRPAKAACLTAEAAGVGDLDPALRPETALVLGSVFGCLEADLEFAASLAEGREIRPALFPYTLPSTCLGELAVRYGLTGPCLCLSTPDGGEADALVEAVAYLEQGEAEAAVVCLGDCLPEGPARVAGTEPRACFVTLILRRGPSGESVCDLDAVRVAPSPLAFVADHLWETRTE